MSAELHTPLPSAPEPFPAGCPARCPGCAHRHLSAAASEARKQLWLQRRLAAWSAQLGALRTVSGTRAGPIVTENEMHRIVENDERERLY